MGADSTPAPESATTLSTKKPDADILAAWGRRSVAYANYNAGPNDDHPDHDPKADAAQLVIIDSAENDIRKAVATSPLGVEIQLWAAISHMGFTPHVADEQAVNIMDFDHFEANESDYDWQDRLVLAAIRSLRAMRAGGAA